MRGRERCIQAALQACRAVALRDLTREGLERFLESLVDRGRSARTVNHYRISMQSFARWLVREGRLASSPFEGLAARDEQADRRLVRRAFTDEELVALLDAARRRPAHDKCTRHRGKGAANVSKATLDRAETRGRERALIYEVLAGTGLRVNELRSVRVRDLVLDANPARVHLRAAHAKNRRDAVLPLHPEIAAHLREWIEERRKRALEESMRAGAPTPLSDDAPVFRIPTSFVHVLDRDLAFAGIPKRDAAGRSLDVHALRTTFAVRLARRNVPLQTAQKLMRHSDPRLTASVYSLLSVEDLAEAVGRLPSLTDLSARDGAADAQ